MGDFQSISVLSYLAAFLGGTAVSLTPCVFPLIPLVVAVIGASGRTSRRRSVFLSLIYVCGMALTFSALGAAAAATGALFGDWSASPAANLVIGNIILLFGLSVLGAVRAPGFNARKAGLGKIFRGGGAAPVFLMGLVSGFIGASCVGPVLGSVLVYVGSTGSVFAGFTLLLAFSAGMGVILVAAGASAGFLKNMAGAGRLMDVARKILGAGLIVLAQYFIFTAGRYAGWF